LSAPGIERLYSGRYEKQRIGFQACLLEGSRDGKVHARASPEAVAAA
jgi:hypothetical protein